VANPEHLAILKQGVEVWNRWRAGNQEIEPDLSGAYLSESSLEWAIGFLGNPLFENADLRGVDFSRADLNHAVLKGANLNGANLRACDLIGANLRRTDLRSANLRYAKLNQVNFTLANLSKADLEKAMFWETVLARTNLSDALGLENCKHGGPSIIDHRTLKRSGALPRSFLQGCGLPDTFIDYFPSLLAEPIQFSSVFISHSSKDHRFAKKLHSSLQANGVRCWFAPHSIQGGRKIYEQIDEAITTYDRLLLILSERSMSSEWVKTEIANARQREVREKRQMLFPISLVPFENIRKWKVFDADTGKDSAREIREYFIPDFSNWKDHASYQGAFQRLLRDLKSEDGKPK
jgi:hypothetical protein